MSLLKHINKKGSYIVEAAMSLPVLIICIVSLALVIRILASIEGIVFEQTLILHKMQMRAPELFVSAKGDNYVVRDFDYLFTWKGMDDLISLETEGEYRVENPVGVKGRIDIDIDILIRGFTGAKQKSGTLSEEEFHEGESEIVIIFPKNGIRFHTQVCRYATQDYAGEEVKLKMQKKDAELKGYTPCLICGSG